MKTKKHTPVFLFAIKLIVVFILGFAAYTTASAAGISNAIRAAIPPLNSSMNAKYVNGIQAAKTPSAGKLLPLNSSKKFPLSVIPMGTGSGLNADLLDGLSANAFALASHNHFGATWTGAANQGIKIVDTQNNATTVQAIWGETSSTTSSSVGVYGVASATSGAVTGVWGTTSSPQGVGVRAWGAGAGDIAIEIASGGIKVPNAGLGTDTPVFIHVANVGNATTDVTRIDNSLSNGDPNAILIVTPNFNPGGGSGVSNDHLIGVAYSTGYSKWEIYNLDGTSIPVGASFNVMIIKP